NVEWTEEHHATRTPEELEQLRLQIDGRPEHPLRFEYEEARRRIEHGPDIVSVRAWLGDRGTSRISLTPEIGRGIEYGITERHFWALEGDWLGIHDPDRGIPDGRDYRGQDLQIRSQFEEFRAGGPLRLLGSAGFRLESATGHEDRWEVVIESANGLASVILVGHRDARFGYLPSTLTFLSRLDSNQRFVVTSQTRRTDWTSLMVRGNELVFAKTIEKRDDDGRLSERRLFESLLPISAQELASYTAVPKPGSEDPVLGLIRLRLVDDYRVGTGLEPVSTTYDGDQPNREVDYAERANQQQRGPSVARAGWIIAGASVVLVLGIAIRARLR
ncbi:MAG: hypothetical protein AAFV49_21575, partial [Pseudomonadota bacterium]